MLLAEACALVCFDFCEDFFAGGFGVLTGSFQISAMKPVTTQVRLSIILGMNPSFLVNPIRIGICTLVTVNAQYQWPNPLDY
jgi:hypothetical protein